MRNLSALAMTVTALCFAATAFGDDGHGKHKGDHTRMTFTLVSDDHGSCQNVWAADTVTRTYDVKANGDGTYTVTRFDRGTFITTGGVSPGACETGKHHGHTVRAGVTGKLGGYLRGTVTGGTFNPNAPCTGSLCGTNPAFFTTFFGPNAQWSCNSTSSTDCKFNFDYTAAHHQALLFRHWQDKGKGAGTMLNEKFHGDIADA